MEEPDDLGYRRTIEQILDVWVEPEIQRRTRVGLLPATFVLKSAQVVMEVGRPCTVRLNEEVLGVMHMKPRPGVTVEAGKPVYFDDIEAIADFQLTDRDPNAGHFTIVSAGDRWLLFFDCRYNATRVQEVIAAAEEFLVVADHARERGLKRAVMENLFAVAELTAKGLLLLMPDERLLDSKSHRFIGAATNVQGHLGNIPNSFVRALNKLTALRGTARYVGGIVAETESDVAELRDAVAGALAILKTRTPKRFVLPP